MPLQRISDLTAGSPPYSGASLVEVSVPTGASPPYVSRSAQISDLPYLTSSIAASTYAPLASPALTGNPTAPTPTPGDADTSIATTAFVGAALSAQVLAGDVTGPTSNTAVVRLQGRPVAATAPTSLQVLQWSGTNWVPATIAAGGTLTGVTAGTGIAVSGAAPSPTVALTVPVSIANGGTGSTTAAAALAALGAAPLASPVFTGDARAVTPATADNDTSIATTAYVQAQGYQTVTAANTAYVAKAGDTMTGALTIATPGGFSTLLLNSAAGTSCTLRGERGVSLRWDINLGDVTAEGGSNSGSNFTIVRYSDAGAFINNPLTINRATGNAVFAGTVTAASPLIINGVNGAEAMAIRGTGGTKWMTFQPESSLNTFSTGYWTGAAYGNIDVGGSITINGPTGGSKGTGTINATGVYAAGSLLTSDASLKTDIEPLAQACLPLITAIEPKSFRWREPDDPTSVPDGWTERRRSGFLAQDLAEAEVPGIVDDKPGEMAVDVGAMLAVLWQALRELSAKVAALEGKPA